MKKNMIIFKQFFSRNLLKALALLIVMTAACIFVTQITSRIEYINESTKYFDGEDIANSDYVTIFSNFDVYFFEKNSDEENLVDEYNKQHDELLEQNVYAKIKAFPAVSNVYYYTIEQFGAMKYNNTETDMYFADFETYERFPYELSDGQWFSSSESSGEYPDAVLCGPNFSNVSIGDTIEINYYAYPEKHKIHVIGKVAAPYKTMELKGDFTKGLSYTNKVFLLTENKNTELFGETILRNPTSAIVTYKEDASEEQIEECRNFYRSFYNDINTVSVNSFIPSSKLIDEAKIITDKAKINLIKEYGLFIITGTLMFLIVSILMIKSKQKEYNLYLLFGSTKKKNFLCSFFSIAFVALLAGIFGTVYLTWFSYAISHGMIVSSNFYHVGWLSYLVMWGYLIINTFIAAIIPYSMIIRKKMTLMTLHRA